MPLTQNIGLEQLSKYFHMPINAVAKELGVCATVLKKICRRNGIPRWPHRKIKSLDKMIASLQAISPKSPEDEERIKQEIAALVNKKRYLITNPNSLVKIKKTSTPASTAAKGKRKRTTSTKPDILTESGEGEETELSPAFLDADILDWDGLASWHEPPFTESELASVPYDSPLGRALLMKPCPLDQLPKLLSPVQSSSASTSRSLHHMAMPSGGQSSFPPFPSHGARVSAFSAKLPDIGAVEAIPVALASEKDHHAALTMAGGGVPKLDVLEPNLLLPSVNPLPFTAQYGIHPITQTLHQHMAPTEWRDNLPPWYSDEYALSSRALLGLPADFATTPTATVRDDAHLTGGPVVGGQPLPHHLMSPPAEATSPDHQPYHHHHHSASEAEDTSHSFIVAGNEGGLSPAALDSADPSIFDHFL